MFINYIDNRKKYISRELLKIKRKISKLPDDDITFYKINDVYRFFQGRGARRRYLKKNDKELIVQLVQKKMLQVDYENLQSELLMLEKVKYRSEAQRKKDEEFFRIPQIKEIVYKKSFEMTPWMQEEYSRNPFHPENLVHDTVFGIKCRSKSEEIIAERLAENNIEFRYECLLVLEGQSFYPDFTLRSRNTNEIKIFEHFGLVDQEEYLKKCLTKIEIYIRNGFIPGVNFFFTFETLDRPLTNRKIEIEIEKILNSEL